jgi:glucan phosphoethanolaminetransferase (alkaline phosphatase superfamily)
MAAVGIEAGVHVFFGLLATISAAALATAIYAGSTDKRLLKILAIAVAIFTWIAWFAVIPIYTIEYKSDKAVIVKYPETAPAHEFGMETKEHIFYTGLFLATLLPLLVYTLDIAKPWNRKLIFWIAVTILIGGFIMDLLGGWIATAAKQAWSFKAGG